MPPWLETAQVIVGTGFVLGTIARGTATWVFNNTLKRDMARINERIDELKSRMDNSGSAEMWDEVQEHVGNIEVDGKLLKQSVDFALGRISTLENNFNASREQRRTR